MAPVGLKKFYKRLRELNVLLTAINNARSPFHISKIIKNMVQNFIFKIKKVPDFSCYIPILNDFLTRSYSDFNQRKAFATALKNIQSFILENCDITEYSDVPIFNFKTLRHEYVINQSKKRKLSKKLYTDNSDQEKDNENLFEEDDAETVITEIDEDALIYDDTYENYTDPEIPSFKKRNFNAQESGINYFEEENNSSGSIIFSNSDIMTEIKELKKIIVSNHEILTETKDLKKIIENNESLVLEIKELKKIVENNETLIL